MPIIIPYLVLFISIYLVIGPIIDQPQIEYLYAVSFILAGLIFYVPFVHFGMTPRFMGMFLFFYFNAISNLVLAMCYERYMF